jgi:hypothetical protein
LTAVTRFRRPALLLALAVAFVVVGPAPRGLPAVANLVYRWQSHTRQSSLLASFPGQAVLESEHFRVHYYPATDAAWAAVVARAAEEARSAVVERLGWVPAPRATEKVPILLYADFDALAAQFGPRAGFRALGAYWGGVIQMVSPSHWLAPAPPPDAAQRLWTEGPLLHECTHYLVDQWVPSGICPRWLAEGLAQYVEYREAGYLWLEPANALAAPVDPSVLYRLRDLERGFDRLPNTALAYRQAFLLVAYLEQSAGTTSLNGLVAGLADGLDFGRALEAATGVGRRELEGRWLLWLDQNLDRYSRGTAEGSQSELKNTSRLPRRLLEGASCRSCL